MSIENFMEEQGEVAARTLERADAQDFARGVLDGGSAYDRVLFVGSGSSLNALTIVRPWLQSAIGRPVEVVNPAVFLRDIGAVFGNPLVVILSQSGTSSTSIEAARVVSGKGWQVVVITADPESPIGALGLPMILLPIGEEPIGPKTKGFTASIAACFRLAAGLARRDLPQLAAQSVDATTEASRMAVASLIGGQALPSYIVVTGSGRHFGVALEASLKIAEIAGVATAGFEPEELLHGRLHGTDANSLVIMIAADEQERDLASHTSVVMAERGVKVVLLNLTEAATPFDWFHLDAGAVQPLDTILASIPFQRLAVDLALRRVMIPDAMTYPGLSKALAIKTFTR
ncbi:SIS domain-containing protein [Neorhizobium sp. Rsf11]|uniref:Glutamine--fructose-6-phosphate aminotransferase [isomerizing] n=2 Tax=Neorhizobium TaxID=1525371 RepID=A0ABV0MB62_9HYPH|nr:SIS domain-containing protein [Neorhizobium petrolearium]MCC2613812.1 SIS domain-containing protein [Neorhizobium petrolearium]WGI72121.1 SIS domain-containing protein [Neorhizobium petrolearium]